MRQTPPDIAEPGWSYGTRVRQMKSLLGEGLRSGVIRIDTPTVDILARCVIGVQWIPENILNELGTRRSLIHERDTVLRGIAMRTD
jgi:hypothetical protein